jgi:hypothetical protein
MDKKYEVLVSFCDRQVFSVKIYIHFKFFKSHKNLYTRSLCITDLEYGGHGQEMWSFDQFLLQTGVFGKTEG